MPLAAHRNAPLLALLIALLAGCTVGPSDRPPVAVRDTGASAAQPMPPVSSPSITPVPPGRYDPTTLPWRDCTAAFAPALGTSAPPHIECTDVEVDADLTTPGLGGSVRLDVSRVGSGPAPLVVLGEAGGEIGTLRAARLAGQLPPAVLQEYTLIGLARRGTGPSDPIDCVPPHIRAGIIGADPNPVRPEQLDDLLDIARTGIQTCVQKLNQLLTVINSASTAGDLEQLRMALAAPVLNLLVLGEASRSAVSFLQRYPASVGRVVLDGAPDPTRDLIATAEAEARATEEAFAAFAADCLSRRCPLAPNPRQALVELAAALRTAPLSSDVQQITAGTAYQAVIEGLGDPLRWPELAGALDAARMGNGSGIAALVQPLVIGLPELPARFDPGLATRCNDSATRVPPERAEQLVEQWRGQHPLFGALFAQQLLLCSPWPVPTEPAGDGQARSTPPVLVIATNGDPRTPAEGTRRTADALSSAVLINWQGRAHGAVGTSPCVTEVVTRYLVDAQLPVQATLCPP
ncbi:MAG: alpha/beta hydrolase [Actinomycetota bacterium]|nr:alpha/beta hydrolase [Actinomycetota bacterium]